MCRLVASYSDACEYDCGKPRPVSNLSAHIELCHCCSNHSLQLQSKYSPHREAIWNQGISTTSEYCLAMLRVDSRTLRRPAPNLPKVSDSPLRVIWIDASCSRSLWKKPCVTRRQWEEPESSTGFQVCTSEVHKSSLLLKSLLQYHPRLAPETRAPISSSSKT